MPGSTVLQSTISDLGELSGCGFLPELSGKQVAEPRLILVSPAGQALQVGHCVLCPHCRPEFFSVSLPMPEVLRPHFSSTKQLEGEVIPSGPPSQGAKWVLHIRHCEVRVLLSWLHPAHLSIQLMHCVSTDSEASPSSTLGVI